MKKIFLLIMIIILSITINVNAEEIPKSGVRYVVTTISGEKYKTFDLNEAKSKTEEEELIFDGKTDKNGEIIISNIGNNASIRILDVQGNKEYKKIIGQDSLTVKVNRIANPKTGQIHTLILLLIGLIAITILVKRNKKIIPTVIVLAAICFIPTTQADQQTIKLVDSKGNKLSNAPIKIYATPTLSYEEVTIKVKFDLTKTFWGENAEPIEGNYASFLDGSKTKEVTFKWDYEDEEWVNDEDVDLRYLYVTWINNRWIEYDYCEPEKRQEDITNQKFYFEDDNISIFFSSTGELALNEENNNNMNNSIFIRSYFQPISFPTYSTLLEEQTITVYEEHGICLK